MKRILVTGAAGKVGSHFIDRILQTDPGCERFGRCVITGILEPKERLEVVRGSISDRAAGARGHAGSHPRSALRHLQGNSR